MNSQPSLVWFFVTIVALASAVAFSSCAGPTNAAEPDTLDAPTACPDPRSFANGVAVIGIGGDNHMEVAKGDPTDEDEYRVLFIAFHDDGEEVKEVYRAFKWHIADPSFIGYFMLDTSGDRSFAGMRVQEDVFDRVGALEEPSGSFRVCVHNDCPDAAVSARCGITVCEPEVCTDDIIVIGVVSLEGSWRFSGIQTVYPEGTISFRQHGRILETAIREVRPVIQRKTMAFYLGGDRYEGEISETRRHLRGSVIRTNDRGADYYVGEWFADLLEE